MRRDEVIARLKEVEPEIRARGAQALYARPVNPSSGLA
jgi:hypothetical protein